MHRVNTEDSLNIRLGPGKTSPDVGNLPAGAQVEVLEGGTPEYAPIKLYAAREFLEEVRSEVLEEQEESAPQEASRAPGDFDFSTKEGAMAAIAAECRDQGIGLSAQIAYVLATVEHETAGTFKPVREAFWKDEAWRETNLRYFPYYGRGYVQLTWEANYRKYAEITGQNFVDAPDLVMDPQVALFILVHGFRTGAFTGKKITDYINETETDFINARRCINGLDQAEKIAGMAEGYPEKAQPRKASGGVSIDRVIQAAESLVHTDYRLGAEIKPGADPAQVKLTDCSETLEFACRQAGVQPVMPDGAMYQFAHCHKHGAVIPVAQALEIRGALLFKFGEHPLQCVQEDRRPSLAHVAISLGAGETFEARSTAAGVGYFDDAREQNWTHASLIPGVDYGETTV